MAYNIHDEIKKAEMSAGNVGSIENIPENLHNDIVIATWAIGPTYRDRVKYHLEEAYNSGYQKLMKFAILTDYVEDFKNLPDHLQNLVVGVYDLNELRKNDSFSFEYEPLPKNVTDDEEYAKEWRYLADNERKLMSYALKRYLLKAISENTNYLKVLMLDVDIELPYLRMIAQKSYEMEFWAHLNTPVNTIRGCGWEQIKMVSEVDTTTGQNKFELIWSRSVGADSQHALQAANVVYYEYLRNKSQSDKFDIISHLPILEGPVRYFNFESKEKMMSFFDTFNSIVKILVSIPKLRSTMFGGTYIWCDYLALSITLLIEKVKSFHFSGKFYTFRTFHEDRFFAPQWFEYHNCNGKNLYLKQAKSRKEFLEINSEIIECMKNNNQWPSISWNCF